MEWKRNMTVTEFKKSLAKERKALHKRNIGNNNILISKVTRKGGETVYNGKRKQVTITTENGQGYIYTPEGRITFAKGQHFEGSCNYEFWDNDGNLYDLSIQVF